MYDKQKKLEKAAGNKAESPESVTIDSDDDEEEEEITEQSLGVFKEVGYILKFKPDIYASLFSVVRCLSELSELRVSE